MSGPAVRTVALAQARTLARAGHLAEAERLLTDTAGEPIADVAVLDLLARIRAQQGRLEGAGRCWERVLELDPGNVAAAAGRSRIAEIHRRAARTFPWRVLTWRAVARTGGTLAVAALLALPLGLWLGAPAPEPTPAAPAASPEPRDLLSELRVAGPGSTVRRSPGEIEVTFERGLFTGGVTLSDDGRRAIEELGRRLRPYRDRLAVTVIGHTDRRPVRPGGDYASNVELGTLRATVVREVLREEARIPTRRFTVSTLAGRLPPHRDAGDPRNRTVTLRISQAGAVGE